MLQGRISLFLKGQNTVEGKFDWTNALIDAFIITTIAIRERLNNNLRNYGFSE
ncbi:MAG: hypothetical protein LBH62_05350 [Nitrososphaerota archaeon]|nr:hypothetical protein [Nitrososphaerota archaeon]